MDFLNARENSRKFQIYFQQISYFYLILTIYFYRKRMRVGMDESNIYIL